MNKVPGMSLMQRQELAVTASFTGQGDQGEVVMEVLSNRRARQQA